MSQKNQYLTKTDMISYIGPMFEELKTEIREFKTEMMGFKSEMMGFKGEMTGFKSEVTGTFQGLREEMSHNTEYLARLIKGDQELLGDHEGRIVNLEVKMDSVQRTLKSIKK